jgi:hypothetical protein
MLVNITLNQYIVQTHQMLTLINNHIFGLEQNNFSMIFYLNGLDLAETMDYHPDRSSSDR